MPSNRSAASVLSFALLVGLLVSALLSAALLAQGISSPNPEPIPTAHIDLSAIAYSPSSPSGRLSDDETSVSLDFVDAAHVLLTFDPKKLMHRLPTCSSDHQDRLMHAAILEIPSGKLVKEADWYLHDRRRYLWPLGSGKFLLRKLNDLFIVDSALHETLLKHSTQSLLWVAVTPDASQIVVETARAATGTTNMTTNGATNRVQDPSPTSPAKRDSKFVAQFFDAKSLALQRMIPLDRVVNLDGTSAGYADLVRKGDIWLIRFGPTPTRRRNIARVRSQTPPDVFYSSNNSFLVGRCAGHDCDYGVTAFSLSGHRLWQQHWSRYRKSLAVVRDEDHSRFGVSTLQLAIVPPAAHTSNVLDEDDINQPDNSRTDVFRQQIQILETASGNTVFSLDVIPSVQSGQNFSLSPDGRRLAVLQGSGLSLFDLPPVSEEEKNRLSSLKSDVSDLYTLSLNSDSANSDSVSSSAESSSDDSSTTPNPEDTAPSADPSPAASADNSTALGTADPAEAKNNSIALPPNANSNHPQAGDPAANNDPIATIRVSAKTVAVDVVVTDSKGHPVKGLSPRDFQLAEDGKTQDVRSFQEFSGPDGEVPAALTPPTPASQSSHSTQPAKPSPNLFSNNTHAAEPGAVTMILFDLLNTPSQDQVYARQQLIKFLQSKPQDSQLALSTMSNGATHLRLIQGFTADETLLLAAAKGKKGAPKAVRWQVSESGTGNAVDTVAVLTQEGRSSGFVGLLSALQGMQAQEELTDTDERAGITLDSMMQLAGYLAGIPGRKNVVWLSGSFPIAISAIANSGNHALDNPNFSPKIKLITNLLADAQIAVYPVDVRGLRGGGPGIGAAAFMAPQPALNTPDFLGKKVIAPAPDIPQDLQAQARESDERDTLNQFAISTGGKAFYNANGIREAIEIAVQQGSNYYTLSYNPANKIYDGKFRKIKVALAEKGYTLHYRQGYFADDAHSAAKDAELVRRARSIAMLHGSPPSRQFLFSARVVPVGGKKRLDRAKLVDVLTPSKTADASIPVEVQHYSIDYTFEGSELRFLPLPNADYRNVLILMATSFDREGQLLTDISNVGTSDLPPDLYKKVIAGDLTVHQETDVPVEAASLRLGIQDQTNNHLGTIEIPLPVPPAHDSTHRIRASLPEIEPD